MIRWYTKMSSKGWFKSCGIVYGGKRRKKPKRGWLNMDRIRNAKLEKSLDKKFGKEKK